MLYDPRQYPLARALCGRYQRGELWYARPGPAGLEAAEGENVDELRELDELARERASQVEQVEAGTSASEALRSRLSQLGIISQRAFVPGARIHAR